MPVLPTSADPSALNSTTATSSSSTSNRAVQYRLTYFNAQGKAEVSRLLFTLAHQPFTDERIPEQANNPSRPVYEQLRDSHSLPFGQLPVLHIDSGEGEGEGGSGRVVLCQSRAIERFIARRFGLMGGSDVEQQQVDSIAEAVRDLTHAYSTSRAAGDEAQKKFLSHTLPTFLAQLSRLAERCSTSSERNTLVGATLTLADVTVFQVFTSPVPEPDRVAIQRLIDGFPIIRAAIQHVADRSEIRQWVAARSAR